MPTSSQLLLAAAGAAAAVAAVAVLVYNARTVEDASEQQQQQQQQDEKDEPEEEEEEEPEQEKGDGLFLIDTSVASQKRKKKRKKKTKLRAGFLNALGGGGIDSPVAKGKWRPTAATAAAAAAVALSAGELEDKAIAEFVSVSKQMQELSAVQGPGATINALQRRRMSLVASLQKIRGQTSMARLESRLAELSPPPPPPEPAELYRQSIAHRIMTDPNFALGEDKPTGIELEVQKTVRRAYWDAIHAKLSTRDPPAVAAVLIDLVSQVIAGILSLREDSPKFQQGMSKVISDKIDLAFLHDQASRDLLTLESFAAVVRELTAIIGQCQSPERDAARHAWLAATLASFDAGAEEVRAAIKDAEDARIAQTMRLEEIVEPTFDGLFEMLETTKRDLVNYQIKMMRAHLTQDGKGLEYQRQKFQARLDAGEITLENTRAFLARGLEVAQTLPGLAGKGSAMIDRQSVTAGSANACRHLLAVSIVDYMYSNSVASPATPKETATAAVAVSPPLPPPPPPSSLSSPLPETLDTEGIALEKTRGEIFGLVEATACLLKVNQFTMSVLKKPALSAAEKATLYDFFRNHSRSLDQHETVKEVEVPVGSAAGAHTVTARRDDGSTPRTKKMLLVTRMDPNGKKLRRVRLEAGAVFAADLLGKRGAGMQPTPTQVDKLEQLFYQLEDDPSADAVFKAATTILRNATLRAIQGAMSAKGNVDAAALVQATAGRSPLGLPPPALAAFGTVLQGVLQLAARNFEIYMESYKAIVTAGL